MIVYTPEYDFRVPGLERLHPFEGTKFSQAWAEAAAARPGLGELTRAPPGPASDRELELVHSRGYLERTHDPHYTLRALEVPVPASVTRALRPLVASVLESRILNAMRWATAGTIAAVRAALGSGLALNLGGGYHHAGPQSGEGFCLYADVPVAIASLRRDGDLSADDRVLIVDLDAHQGNGFERCFAMDRSVYFLDVFNADIYPQDGAAAARIDRPVRLRSGLETAEYLETVKRELDEALREAGAPRLAVYIAGTDVYAEDPLGGLAVSRDGVVQRDRLVIARLRAAGISTAVVTGGGYSPHSKHLVAALVELVVDAAGEPPGSH